MTDGIARAMSAGCQSPLAPSDEGAATEGDWGRDIRFAGSLVFIVSPSVGVLRKHAGGMFLPPISAAMPP